MLLTMDDAISTDLSRQPKKLTPACEKCRVLKVKCIRPEEGQPCTKWVPYL